MTRYEKGDRKPSKERLNEIAKILLINENELKLLFEDFSVIVEGLIVSHIFLFFKPTTNQ